MVYTIRRSRQGNTAMTLPRYKDIDVALLLELVRLGKPVRPHETYEAVTRHFPQLTHEDKTVVRKDGRTRVWINMIHWARDHVRVQGALEETDSGIWSANRDARRMLEAWLRQRGGSDPARFIESTRLLQDHLGSAWAQALRSRKAPVAAPERRSVPEKPPVSSPAISAPQADLETLQEREVDGISKELLDRLTGIDEYAFENFVARILEALGFRDTRVVGRPGDGGVDVMCELRTDVVGATVAVQVKRQQSNIGPKEVSYLRDRWARKADKLLFIATGGYTAGAREVAEERDVKTVTLVDGRELAELMIRNKIGVQAQVVERLLLDEDFFAE